jgi:hypothetical protein
MVEEVNITKVEEKVIEEKTEKAKASTEKLLKIWSVGIGIFLILSLIVIKVQNPDFPLKWVLIISGIVLFICLFIFFSFAIFRKSHKEEEKQKTPRGLPQPASLATLRGICESSLTNRYFANHTTGCLREYYTSAGKNHDRIYVYVTKALYFQNMREGKVYIIVNSHYPLDLRSVLIDPTSTELTKCINYLSTAPEEEPNTEETSIYNPLTQTIVNTRKVEKPKELEKPKEEKKGDLE